MELSVDGYVTLFFNMLSAPDDRHWLAMKVFFNKVFEMEDDLKAKGVETYIPVVWEERVVGGKRTRVRKPAVSSLLFLHASPKEVADLQDLLKKRAMLYADRQTRIPSVIPDREMRMFKMVTSASSDLEYVDPHAVNFQLGEHVRVIDGTFKGAEGYIKRIKGNRRLIVAIEGVVAVATSYIPSIFLEKVEEG